jgi:putative flippase GtrA
MNIARQGISFMVIGGCLVVADWAVFVMLTALGWPPPMANIAGRIVGALLGFWANGRITFASALGRHRFIRFAVVWTILTLLSTWLVTIVVTYLGLQMAWLAKPLVEGGLAILSFIMSRHWVYR